MMNSLEEDLILLDWRQDKINEFREMSSPYVWRLRLSDNDFEDLEEAINVAVMQTLIEEGLWSNLKGAWQGMKQGAQMGRALGSDAKADYANGNEATRNWDLYDGRKDAKGSIMKFSEMAKNYDAIAAQLREKAKALATKWNIVRSNVGQAGPAQYGYKKQPQPQAQPNPVADNPTPVNEALVRKVVAESIKKIMKEGI